MSINSDNEDSDSKNDICAICLDNMNDEPFYSHLDEYNVNKLTKCKMHKSCLNRYVQFTYCNSEYFETCQIACPVCKTSIYSSINTVIIVKKGKELESLAFSRAPFYCSTGFKMFIFQIMFTERIRVFCNNLILIIKDIMGTLITLFIFYNVCCLLMLYFNYIFMGLIIDLE